MKKRLDLLMVERALAPSRAVSYTHIRAHETVTYMVFRGMV